MSIMELADKQLNSIKYFQEKVQEIENATYMMEVEQGRSFAEYKLKQLLTYMEDQQMIAFTPRFNVEIRHFNMVQVWFFGEDLIRAFMNIPYARDPSAEETL